MRYITFWGLLISIGILAPSAVLAQEADTTKKELNLNQKNNLGFERELDRPVSGGKMTGMGAYNVPTETKYYKRPFKGQDYLDLAVEAYRKEVKNDLGNNWFWQFLKAVSPYINNSFEFGFYNTDVPYVDRDNPLFQSYQSKEKRQ